MKPWSQDWLIAAGAYPGFCSMKWLEVFVLPLDGMLVHRRSLPRNLLGFPNNLLVPIYTPGWREALSDRKGNNKVSKCKLKKYLFGGKNERKSGEFHYSMTIIIRPLVA